MYAITKKFFGHQQFLTSSPDKLLIFDEGFKLGPSWDGDVESLRREERLEVKEIEIVVINEVSEKLVAKTIEGGHYSQGEVPSTVSGAVDKTVQEREKEEFKRPPYQTCDKEAYPVPTRGLWS